MKLWNAKGLRTSLGRGRKSTVHEPSGDSVFKLGAAVPIFSRLFVGGRIKSREGSIRKIGSRLEKMVTVEKGKIEKVIAAAERTDIHSLVQRARSLRDKLENAACSKVKFVGTEDEEGEAPAPGRPPKPKPIQVICAKAIARDVLGKDQTTGMVTGKGATQKFKRMDLQVYLEKCVQGGGKVTIAAAVVDALTAGAKKTDVEIDVTGDL